MNKYEFYLDRKLTIWERESFEIEADSKEEAIAKIKAQYEKEGNELYFEGNSETLFDTQESMLPQYNQAPTIEIFDKETEELILANWEPY